MAGEAVITVKFGDQETIDLIKAMGQEIQDCYNHLDEVAAMIGSPPYPRNLAMLALVKAWGESLQELAP